MSIPYAIIGVPFRRIARHEQDSNPDSWVVWEVLLCGHRLRCPDAMSGCYSSKRRCHQCANDGKTGRLANERGR
jgi:hypothetical protein